MGNQSEAEATKSRGEPRKQWKQNWSPAQTTLTTLPVAGLFQLCQLIIFLLLRFFLNKKILIDMPGWRLDLKPGLSDSGNGQYFHLLIFLIIRLL